MEVLKTDERLKTNFIVRDTFSGNTALVAGDVEKMRRQFIENISGSDFVLAPKGDGNYSQRFYEALSLGRIPILVDTDMRLPLEAEGIVDYKPVIVRVPYSNLARVGDYIMDFWDRHDDASYAKAQESARELFSKHLEYESFWETVLNCVKEKSSHR